ncbi:hypothetical protein M758_4G125400 [Ceratodon purpureus]|nr:hypothetical protein M758_4G125400 [Ceratodon purpureus]
MLHSGFSLQEWLVLWILSKRYAFFYGKIFSSFRFVLLPRLVSLRCSEVHCLGLRVNISSLVFSTLELICVEQSRFIRSVLLDSSSRESLLIQLRVVFGSCILAALWRLTFC